MSILIKGMEMPEHCGYCRFRYDGICHALQKTQYNRDDCPLVPIPPHGRLIDADAMEYKMLYKEIRMCGTGVEALGVWKSDIDAAPTIIDEEDGGKRP